MPKSTKRKQAFVEPRPSKRQQIVKSCQQRDKADWLRNNDQYCARCRSLDLEKLLSTADKPSGSRTCLSATIYPLGMVYKTMSSSECPLCRVFAKHFPAAAKSGRQECVLRKLSAKKYYFPYSSKRKMIQDTMLLSITQAYVRGFNPVSTRKNGMIYLTDKPTNTNDRTIHFNSIDPSRVNYELINKWIQYCKKNHRGYCKRQLHYNVHTIPGFKLIDCENRVLANVFKRVDYVALSYVWGNNSDTGCLSQQAPKVIEDAIIATKELGYRYLWVDRYCINQIDEEEKHAQVTNMDQIYADAVVTIAAVAGEGPEHGLPGVSQTLRHTQPTAVVGKYHIISSLRSPRDDILSSKWASRGWTFQELKLSRRILFFTDEQVIYECASMSCQETVQIPMETFHQKWSRSTGRECDRMRIFAPNGPGRYPSDIFKTISEYTSRNLAWSSDNLNAISGIFNTFNINWSSDRKSQVKLSQDEQIKLSRSAVHHLWGMPILADTEVISKTSEMGIVARKPIDYFCTILGWRTSTPSTRSSQLPSWSWVGWTLPSRIDFNLPTDGGKAHTRRMLACASIFLILPKKEVDFEKIGESPEYSAILRDASQFLIMGGFVINVRFDRAMDKEFKLRPRVEGNYDSDDILFWPNAKLETDLDLERFTQRSWKAIAISTHGTYSCYLLVVEEVDRWWERVGLLRIQRLEKDFFEKASFQHLILG